MSHYTPVWGIGSPRADNVYDSRAIGWASIVEIASSVEDGAAKERVHFWFATR